MEYCLGLNPIFYSLRPKIQMLMCRLGSKKLFSSFLTQISSNLFISWVWQHFFLTQTQMNHSLEMFWVYNNDCILLDPNIPQALKKKSRPKGLLFTRPSYQHFHVDKKGLRKKMLASCIFLLIPVVIH